MMQSRSRIAVIGLFVAAALASATAARAEQQWSPSNPPPPMRWKGPGLGKASWRALYIGKDAAFFYTSIDSSGARPAAWFTSINPQPEDYGGLKGVTFQQERYEADCARNTVTRLHMIAYDREGRELTEIEEGRPHSLVARPNTTAGDMLGVLCGRRKGLSNDSTELGDINDLVRIYAGWLAHWNKQ